MREPALVQQVDGWALIRHEYKGAPLAAERGDRYVCIVDDKLRPCLEIEGLNYDCNVVRLPVEMLRQLIADYDERKKAGHAE